MLIDSPLKLELFRILSDFLGLKRVLRTKSLRNAVVEKNSKQSMNVFPGGSVSKESACYAGDLGSIPGLGRSPGEGHGNPLQYSCLEHSMEFSRGAWWATVHGVAKSRTRLSDQHFHFHGKSMFNFLKNCHSIFHSDLTIVHSHQQMHEGCNFSNFSSTLVIF